MIDRHQTVASLVLDHSECAEVLQRHRIDFCCRGHLSIEEAAKARHLDPDAVLAELGRAIVARRAGLAQDPRELSTAALVEHIVAKHHAYLRTALPVIRQLAAKVSRVHGAHNARLPELAIAVEALAATLGPHLDEEEQVLFPRLASDLAQEADLAEALAEMRDDHQVVAELLERIRAAAEDFTLPEWACRSYRALFSELEALESDVFRHVHLENHVLAPRFAPSSVGRPEPSARPSRRVTRYLEEDHQRLGALFARARARSRFDEAAFEAFRAGLLRHIAIEEKLLFPVLRRGGRPESLARVRDLHVEHGALGALLVPTPSAALCAEIEVILLPHERKEEGSDGVYAECERALSESESEALAARAEAFAEVRVAPHLDGPRGHRTAADALAAARRMKASTDEQPL